MASNWLSKLAIPAAALGIEAAWLVPAAAMALNGLAGGAAAVTPLASLALFAAAGLGLRALASLAPGNPVVRAVTVAAACTTTLLITWAAHFGGMPLLGLGWPAALAGMAGRLFYDAPDVAGTLVVCGALWWRAVAFATAPLTFDQVSARFQLGLGLLILFHFIALVAGGVPAVALALGNLGPNVLALFLLGLPALALSRVEDERMAAAPGRAPAFNRQWAALLAAVLAAELGTTLLLAGLLAPETAAAVAAPFAWAGSLLLQALALLVVALSYLAELLLNGLLWLFSLLGLAPQPRQFDMPSAPVFPEEAPEEAQPRGLPEAVLTTARGGLVALVVAGALLVLWRALARRNQRPAPAAEEVRDSVWSWQEARADLADALDRLLGRLRRSGQAAVAAVAGVAGALEHDDVRTVRGVYRALLRSAQRRGWGRHPHQTPEEFAAVVAAHARGAADDVARITALYQPARYGPAGGDDTAAAAEAAEAWRRVRQQWQAPGG